MEPKPFNQHDVDRRVLVQVSHNEDTGEWCYLDGKCTGVTEDGEMVKVKFPWYELMNHEWWPANKVRRVLEPTPQTMEMIPRAAERMWHSNV